MLARVTITNAGESTTFPFAIHLIALGRGRGDIGVIAMGPGTGIPAASLRTFAQLLASRMEKAGL